MTENALSKQKLAQTMVSPETGETLRRDVRPFIVGYKGKSITVELPGYYPETGDDQRVREKLKLSQHQAGGLLKVGVNAFDKYERGVVEPSGPTSQLLRLLDQHPELIEDLRASV